MPVLARPHRSRLSTRTRGTAWNLNIRPAFMVRILSIFGRYRTWEGAVKSSKVAECESESPAIFFAVVTRVSTVECDYWKSPHEQ
jgi:hypothetical protein